MQPDNETTAETEAILRGLAPIADIMGIPAAELHARLVAEREQSRAAEDSAPSGGYFAVIAFMGRLEHTGYVTEITKNGQPAYHVDLPDKLWGGNPLAYVEYAASAWFSERPVTGESVRAAWEAAVAARARRTREDAEWRERQERALAAGDEDDDPDGEDQYRDAF